MLLLFGFYGSHILAAQDQEKSRFPLKYLRFVVNSIKSKKKMPLSITLIAVESLLRTIFNKKSKKKYGTLIKEIFKLFVKKLPSIQYPQFYDLIENILK